MMPPFDTALITCKADRHCYPSAHERMIARTRAAGRPQTVLRRLLAQAQVRYAGYWPRRERVSG